MNAHIKSLLKKLFATVFLFQIACSHVSAETAQTNNDAICAHLEFGTPKKSDFVDCREGYAIGYNYQLKSAEWVAYRLEHQEEGTGVDRTNDFRVDTKIPQQYQTTPSDYDEPIYDQGHLANSESIDTSENAMSETFFMSNMVPQLPGHNRAIWKGLENRERKWANKRGLVYVYAGPLFIGQTETIGNKVPVPSHLWKVIYDPVSQEAIAYVIEHKKLPTSKLDNYLESVDKVEALSNLDLLNTLEESLQAQVESTVQSRQWK